MEEGQPILNAPTTTLRSSNIPLIPFALWYYTFQFSLHNYNKKKTILHSLAIHHRDLNRSREIDTI